ncbi:MAG TPA: VOC family protein [Pyrinomonadaceae bacterium]|nr:VOC family protein [Pyrinomonadaceae bacterium]
MPNKKRPRLNDIDKEQLPPPIAIGHVTLRVSEVGLAADFYETLGLRPILNREELAILELRGGTHLVLFRARGKPKAGPVRVFDFMVEDIEAAHAAMEKAGVGGTAIREDHLAGHLWFEVTDPDGHVLKVFSSHAGGRPV